MNVAKMSAMIRTEKCSLYLAVEVINDLQEGYSGEEIRKEVRLGTGARGLGTG